MKQILTIPAVCLIFSFQANSQCVHPTPPVTTCGTGTPLADNAAIATGDTYYYNASGGSFTNISINGGTLILCSSVTITNLNFNSGNLIINPGATVRFNGSFNGGTNNFYNFGTAIFNENINIQGASTVYNDVTASMTVNASLTVFSSGIFLNDGTAIAQQLIINSGAAICLGPSSISNAASITNNQNNVITVPVGNACVGYTSTFTGNFPITSSANLSICQAVGASDPSPVVIGAATVIPNCSGCNSALPLTLISFKGTPNDMGAELEWKTAMEENLRSFKVERSRDGQVFEPIGEVMAMNQPSTYKFPALMAGDTYFRLKMIDQDGKFTYSPILLLRAAVTSFRLSILSNPVARSYAELSFDMITDQNGQIIVTDNIGRLIKKVPVSLVRGSNLIQVDVAGMGAGQYYLYFSGRLNKSRTIPFTRL